MTLKFSTDILNARLDAIESIAGISAVLKIRVGAPPALISDPDSGVILATVVLPVDWMAAAVGGSKTKAGTWEDLAADAAGTCGHFRIYESTGVTPKIQGTCTITGGGGDMTVDNDNFAPGQKFTVTSFTITDGN